ncbi:MAG: DEAD/DEAH box helicase, partial [Chitinophagales bacterium]|nr:DEAD/DEAH box helicase [Chitinophagales bacterium]
MEKFRVLGLSENTVAALEKKGWETPSTIQERVIPILLKDEKDVVGQAQTGTGKTGAFGLPLIDKLDDTSKKVQALIMCPTRELAIQVAEEISSFKGNKRLWVQSVYGGASFSTQARAIEKGAQIIVGTPGRIRDHIERKTLKLDAVTHVVLDEADEMLNMGFEEEVREILKSVPEKKRMLLFSATMPQPILKIAKTFMGEYELIAVEKKQMTIELVDQIYFEVRDHDRFETLCRIIDTEPEFYGIVFCRTKADTDIVADKLVDKGYDAEAIHGDVTQNQRELTLKKFKLKKVTILVATDVAARGIDVNDLTHVVNYNLPQDPEAYVHRIGRTGRAGKHGTAISIISSSERRDLLFIQKIVRTEIKREEVPGIEEVIQVKKA